MCIFFILTITACGQNQEQSAVVEKETFDITIVALGDSLTAGYGIAPSYSYPAQLEEKLQEKGYSCRVINSGVSGETSRGTLSRLNWIINLKPDIIIVETGANDGMRGIDPLHTKENIITIINQLKENDIVVILAGMRMLENLGKDYTIAFNAIYQEIAKETGVIFMPFFLDKVAAIPSLNIHDGIHPTRSGYTIITENILPFVMNALEERLLHDSKRSEE